MNKVSKIYVAGHRGLVGSSLERLLTKKGYTNLILRSHKELELTNQYEVKKFFEKEKPEYVFIAAAKVGGIQANINSPAEFIYDNIQIQNNIINCSKESGVKKLLFLGSACIYPAQCEQPIREEYLLTGKFEPTNEPYAIAKIAGIGICKAYNKQYGTNFISAIPTNLFGPGDNFHPQNSHLMAALIKKFHEAKTQEKPKVTLWGTGTPRRELLYVNDAAEACLFLMDNYNSNEPINIGTGKDNSIAELAEIVRDIVGYNGNIEFDASKPDGMMRRVLDISKINAMGWYAQTSLQDGIKEAYKWFLEGRWRDNSTNI